MAGAGLSLIHIWEAAAYGVNIPFTASARTGRYQFEIYDGESASGAPLASYGEARLTPGAQVKLYLPFAYDPVAPHTYTLRCLLYTSGSWSPPFRKGPGGWPGTFGRAR